MKKRLLKALKSFIQFVKLPPLICTILAGLALVFSAPAAPLLFIGALFHAHMLFVSGAPLPELREWTELAMVMCVLSLPAVFFFWLMRRFLRKAQVRQHFLTAPLF